MNDRNRFNDQSRYQQEVNWIRRDENGAEGKKKLSGDGLMALLGFALWVGFPVFLWFKYLA